jgi:hypothetical protein
VSGRPPTGSRAPESGGSVRHQSCGSHRLWTLSRHPRAWAGRASGPAVGFRTPRAPTSFLRPFRRSPINGPPVPVPHRFRACLRRGGNGSARRESQSPPPSGPGEDPKVKFHPPRSRSTFFTDERDRTAVRTAFCTGAQDRPEPRTELCTGVRCCPEGWAAFCTGGWCGKWVGQRLVLAPKIGRRVGRGCVPADSADRGPVHNAAPVVGLARSAGRRYETRVAIERRLVRTRELPLELLGRAVPISAPGPDGRSRGWGAVTWYFPGGISRFRSVNWLAGEMGSLSGDLAGERRGAGSRDGGWTGGDGPGVASGRDPARTRCA